MHVCGAHCSRRSATLTRVGRDSVRQNRRNRGGKGGAGCPGEAVGLGDRGGSLEPAARVPGTGSMWLWLVLSWKQGRTWGSCRSLIKPSPFGLLSGFLDPYWGQWSISCSAD